ncbi:MAG: zinc carboxypeptidase, partial [Bacteroidota bacterium]
IITAIGDTLTLADRILHHHTTGLSTVEATSADAERVVAEFEQYFDDAENRPEGPYRTFVVKATNSRAKLDTLRFYLARQRIQFGYADRQRRLTGFDYGRAMLRDVTVEPGDLVVSMYQPKGVLARVLFEPEAQLADSLTYDITAWALPYAYGLEAYALTDRIDPVVRALPEREQALPADAPPYAYAFAWDSFDALQTLTTLLRHHVRVRYAERPFEVEGNRYPAGSIIALRADNAALEDRFDAAISEAAAQTGQLVRPVATGFVTEGADFGSSDVRFLDAPNVLLLAGQGVSSNATGEVWHYFDQQIGYPVTLIEPDRIDNVDLDDYDVIVLPSGAYGGILEAPVLEELRGWIRDGGRLIAIEGAASFLAGMDGFQLRRKPREAEAEDEDPEDLLVSYGDRERRRITERIPGSIYAVDLDPTHPLAYGYGETYFTLKRSTRDFAFLDGGWNVGVLRPDAYRSGFTGSKVFDDLDDTLVFGVQDLGRGHVIYMIDNPLFRGFWYEGKLLFGNAVFMVD